MARRVICKDPVWNDGPNTHVEGDTFMLDDDKAATWIELGVLADAETGECGERKPGAHRLEFNKLVQST